MNKFTIILLRPDYMVSSELDTYTTHITADTPAEAVSKAQREAYVVDYREANDPKDYAVIAVFSGHLYSLTY